MDGPPFFTKDRTMKTYTLMLTLDAPHTLRRNQPMFDVYINGALWSTNATEDDALFQVATALAEGFDATMAPERCSHSMPRYAPQPEEGGDA